MWTCARKRLAIFTPIIRHRHTESYPCHTPRIVRQIGPHAHKAHRFQQYQHCEVIRQELTIVTIDQYSRVINNISLSDFPLNNFSISSRLISRWKLPHDIGPVPEFITFRDHRLIRIPEQSLIPLNRIARLLEQRRHRDWVVQTGRQTKKHDGSQLAPGDKLREISILPSRYSQRIPAVPFCCGRRV